MNLVGLQGSTVTLNQARFGTGFNLQQSQNVKMSSNTVSVLLNGWDALDLDRSPSNQFTQNTFEGGGSAIYMSQSPNNASAEA